MFTLPDESKSKKQHHKTDGTNRVEDISHANRADPRYHSEDENCGQDVPHKGKRNKCVTDNLYSLN